VVCAINFSGGPHVGYALGVPAAGAWVEVLNTDAEAYGGSGVLNAGPLTATDKGLDGQPATLTVTLPPLGAAYFKPSGEPAVGQPSAAQVAVKPVS
jgi:1,4-alpha-glucan branching enzyme